MQVRFLLGALAADSVSAEFVTAPQMREALGALAVAHRDILARCARSDRATLRRHASRAVGTPTAARASPFQSARDVDCGTCAVLVDGGTCTTLVDCDTFPRGARWRACPKDREPAPREG